MSNNSNILPSSKKKELKRSVKWELMLQGSSRYLVFYPKDGIEKLATGFYNRDRAHKAREILINKGYRAVVYID